MCGIPPKYNTNTIDLLQSNERKEKTTRFFLHSIEFSARIFMGNNNFVSLYRQWNASDNDRIQFDM